MCLSIGNGRNLKYKQSVENIIKSGLLNIKVPFISNKDQIDKDVEYYAHTFGGTAFITKSGNIVYSFLPPANEHKINSGKYSSHQKSKALALKEQFINGKLVKVRGENEVSAKVNYIQGADRLKWKRDIPAFESVCFGEVYKGIDIQLKAFGNNIEKLFFINPGANPMDIKIEMAGAKNLKVNNSGELEVETEMGTVSFTKPVAYQEHKGKKNYIPVEYKVNKNEYGFRTGNYDSEKTLVIDPLIASTFLGGSDIDDMYEPTIALDNNGNIYITGFTSSPDFPTTTGVYNTKFNRVSRERFISKFNSDLSQLLASTFIGGRGFGMGFVGGDGDELGHGLAVNKDGNVYIAGYTESPDYPVTSGSFDESFNGGRDVFVSKLSGDLSTLLASTYIGGSGDEGFQWPRIDMTLNNNGDVIVAGITHSNDFPISDFAYDKTYNGGSRSGDAFIVKFDRNLTRLLASTYLGGKENEWRLAVVMDKRGTVYVCGQTESLNFPTTSGAYRETFTGDNPEMGEIFISKIDSDLSKLLASTLFGGDKDEEALKMRVDEGGEIYLSGYTDSENFPTTEGAYNREWNGGNRDAFVAKFDNNLGKLTASTLLGGSMRDMCRGMIFNEKGEIYVTGMTESADFPVTPGAYKNDLGGVSKRQREAFISKFNNDLSELLISSCFGGNLADDAFCIEMDKNGDLYVAGLTSSKNFPVSEGAYDNSYNGGRNDCFISKFDSELSGK